MGRLHQLEYALEAVKQGSACVGIKSKTHVVLLALQRQGGELASYQKKITKLDNHMGIAFAGLTSDARVLSNYMRTECMRHRLVFARPLPALRAVSSVADKAQANTQSYGSRPYGVGFLVGAIDDAGTHLYEFTPAANALDYIAQSIGARSQSARTYLEKHVADFENCSLNQLIQHGLISLRDTLPSDKELTLENVAIAVVGKGSTEEAITGFHTLPPDDVDQHLRKYKQTHQQGQAPATSDTGAEPAAGSEPQAMETD